MRLSHFIYTNRAGADRRGFRSLISAGLNLTASDRDRLENWSGAIELEPQSDSLLSKNIGFVTSPLHSLIAGSYFGIVLATNSFGKDDHGRPTLLRHLVIIEIEKGVRGNLLASGLDQLKKFWRRNRDVSNLEDYLLACAKWEELEPSSTDLSLAKSLDADVWRMLYQFALPQVPTEIEIGVEMDPSVFVDALGFLPPLLRYGVGFSIRSRAPGAAWLRPGHIALQPKPDVVWGELINLATHQPSRLAEILNDWKINSFRVFKRILEEEAEGPAYSLGQSSPQDQKMPVRKIDKAAGSPISGAAPAQLPNGTQPVLSPQISEGVSPSEQRLRAYVDLRLGILAEEIFREPSFYGRFKVEIWGLLVIGIMLLALAVSRKEASSISSPETSSLPRQTPATPVSRGNLWPDWVKANASAVIVCLEGLRLGGSVPPESISDVQKNNSERLVRELKERKWKGSSFADCRLLLFEYVLRKERPEIGLRGKINQVIEANEYPKEELARAAIKLGISEHPDAKDPDFQAAVVMAHIDRSH